MVDIKNKSTHCKSFATNEKSLQKWRSLPNLVHSPLSSESRFREDEHEYLERCAALRQNRKCYNVGEENGGRFKVFRLHRSTAAQLLRHLSGKKKQ